MKPLLNMLLVLATFLMSSSHASTATCQGAFPNPITDICWSCTLPITIGGSSVMSNEQEDIANPEGFTCHCDGTARIGLSIGFWEPVRSVDVVRKPFCLVSLGGIDMDPGFDIKDGDVGRVKSVGKHSFYQTHWYVNPIMYWLEVLLDHQCLEQSDYDIAYLTEFDPLYNDEELSMILNPDAVLFGNLIAQAACAVDCVAASSGFGRKELFWCAGCQGNLYPLTGDVVSHHGGVQASELLLQRITAKMHREGLTFSTVGDAGMCGFYAMPMMDKTHYKAQLTYPIPNTRKINGRCCSPYGRTTVLWGAGKEYMYEGENFAYQIWRKRNCCMGAIGL